MKEAKRLIRDPDLVKDLERFNAQEGQHYRQHRRFNEAVRMAGFDRLPEFERELEDDYQRFTDSKSLKFNLAYAEGFEALTTATARFSFEMQQLDRMQPAVRDLLTWHLVEELEHRTVAFDVYDHIYGDYFYRLRWGFFGQRHMFRWIDKVARYMLETDKESLAKYGGHAGRRSRQRMQARAAIRGLLPKLLATYMPWYTPEKIEFTAEMKALGDHYTAMSVSAAK
jgi:predicted metal-dependent hydrolase